MQGASPRRRSARLGKIEAQNFPVSATPQRGLLRLGVGPRLGKGPLSLGKLKVLFFSHFFC